jgi:predicted transcriptional regulator
MKGRIFLTLGLARLNNMIMKENTRRKKVPTSIRRSNIEIIADILRNVEYGAGKTELMYSTNLSHIQIKRYLEFLIDEGFIYKMQVSESAVVYQCSEKGSKTLNTIDTLMRILEPRPEKLQ